ncbi:Alginate biosynthesis sensor protein kinB [Nocardia otitidiscaviarum]|uniref:histidine kinase n=1 Tax=Nocardia otitidiscaviarum TaxID=1823 RepID=A0A379JHY9_9NOCA|nr:ATP-binding protein [Nocardia otitidiscaviarum]SUD47976.1 Alginate biosynthesis sensor protein kinB [Nocardia otitidiscaviarum]
MTADAGTTRWRPARSVYSRAVLAFALSASLVSLVLAVSVFTVGRGYMEGQRERSAVRLTDAHIGILRQNVAAEQPTEADLVAIEPPDGTVMLVRWGDTWIDSDSALATSALLSPDIAGGSEESTQRVTVAGKPYLRVGLPLNARGDMFYEFTPIAELDSTLRMLRNLLIACAIVASSVGAVLGVWASRRVLKPLHQLAVTASRIASGELDTRLPRTADRDLSDTVDAFNTMVDSLQQRIERERRLVGDVSHELRTPLTTLVTSVGVMNKYEEQLPERMRRALRLTSDELSHMRRMLDDMLELARVDAGVHRGDVELLSLGELLTHALAERHYPPELLTVVTDSTIEGRRLELERTVANLLENATRHGGGPVAVTVRRDGAAAVITVDDAGPGVPVADRNRIFERFATIRVERGAAVGTGIGLALVSETVAAHGGRVYCEDRPGGGARFVVRLPRVEAEVLESEREPTSIR